MPDLLDLLDWTDAPEWEPVWEPRLEDYGWRFAEAGSVLYDGDGSRVTPAQWKAYLARARCRDCGVRCEMNQGGAVAGRGFRVCDDCARLDHCLTREHDRGSEWHVSHWGDSHRADEHDELVRKQAKRRRAYLARQTTVSHTYDGHCPICAGSCGFNPEPTE